jgi:hypothetical protein
MSTIISASWVSGCLRERREDIRYLTAHFNKLRKHGLS